MIKYLTILEQGPTSWGAYAPDVPGCVAVAETRTEVRTLFQEALTSHLDWLRVERDPIPSPVSETDFVTVALPGHAPRRYLVILTPTPIGSWSATPADVPDLTLEFSDRAGALRLLQGALQEYLEEQSENGQAVPAPSSEAVFVSVMVPVQADALFAAASAA